MPMVKDVVDNLNRLYQPDEHIAVAIWCEDDVIGRANERNMSITIEEARGILEDMDNNHDAEMGITWDTIDSGLDALRDSPYR